MGLQIRTNKHGELCPPIHPHVSGHRSYKVAVRTAKRRQASTGLGMAVVTWHNANFVVMPAEMAWAYDEAELLVEYA
jgi:hypothetical protein